MANEQLKKNLQREYASHTADIFNPVNGSGVLSNLDKTVLARGGGRGLELYDDVERDPHAYAVLEKRKRAPLSRPWDVKPRAKRLRAQKAADFVRDALWGLFDDLCYNMADAILKGFAVIEVIWDNVDGQILPVALKGRDPRRFYFDQNNRLLLRVNKEANGPQSTIYLPERKFIVLTFNGRYDNPYGQGLGGKIWWYVFFKREMEKLYANGLEKFAIPPVIGSTPEGMTDDESVRKVFDMLQALASDSTLVKPASVEVDTLNIPSYDPNAFKVAIDHYNEEISKAVLGETLTTNMGKTGSRAATETHNDVRLELTQADSDVMCAVINNTLVKWIIEFNFPGNTDYPLVFRDLTIAEDMTKRAQRDAIISSMGFKPKLEYIQEMYGGLWEEVQDKEPQGSTETDEGQDDSESNDASNNPSVSGPANGYKRLTVVNPAA